MKSKVEQYAKGDFYIEYPEVKLSRNYLQLKVEAGSVHSGSIFVSSENDIPMKMMVFDDAYFLTFEDHSIVGRKGEIKYSFSGVNKVKGSVYEGIIHVIGNGTEILVPYNIEIVAPFIDVDKVAIEDLMKFSAFAETDWNKAIEVFYSDEFEKTLLAGNGEYIEVYRSLLGCVDKNQALEEFLVYIHKKRALTLQVEHDRFQFNYPKMKEDHEIILNKNTWGYCKMKVYTEDHFIELHQSEVCSMDFDGESGVVRYSLNPELLDEEKATSGHIILENTYQKITVSISIRRPEEEENVLHKNHDRKLRKLEKASLIHNYLDYRTGVISLEMFIENAKRCLRNLVNFEPKTGIYKLGLIHMSILAGQEDNARQEIRRMEEDSDSSMNGEREHCYYLYLKAMLSKDTRFIVASCEEIEQALTNCKDKVFFFWLLINLDERYQRDRQWLFSQIEGLYLGGYDSPVLAIEVCDLFNQEPLILKKLGRLETSVLAYGLNNKYLSKEVVDEFLHLADKEKAFTSKVFRLLNMVYEIERKPEIIRIICSLLIKGGKLENRYNKYYLEGIKCGYKLVGIQENYLRTMDKSRYDTIPDAVLRYFNYKSFLTDSEYAYLYANVIVNKRQYLSQFEEYLPNILGFMEGQIIKGNVSDDLSVIYSEFLRPQSVNAHYASSLVNVIFKRKLTVASDSIIAVIVNHRELDKELVVPVKNKVAYVDMITESAVITLVDRNRNRYVSTIPYRLEKLVDEDQYIDLLARYSSDDYRYILYRYAELSAFDAKDAREVNIARDLLSFNEISKETKQQAIWGIVRYYRQHLDMDILSTYLDRVENDYVPEKNSGEYINNLIMCGLFDKAYGAIKQFGYNDVDNENLIKLVDVMKGFSQYAREDTLISVAKHLYTIGQDTTPVLEYLVSYYQSGLKDMVKLWKRANGRVRKIEGFEENIICLMLYTEQWENDLFPVFESYVRRKKRGMVIKAFFKRASFAYLVEQRELPEGFFDEMLLQMTREEWTDDMCRAAMLKYLSEKTKLEELEVNWLRTSVEYFVKRGILLPFFRNFKKYVKLPKDLFLLTYVVTRDKAGKQISFMYNIQSGIEKPEINREARMMEVLPGYYVKEFVLFHGENLLYRMKPEHEKTTKVYESMAMKAKGETEQYENRFEMLNSMLINQEIGDNRMLLDKIGKYVRLSAVLEENIQIL